MFFVQLLELDNEMVSAIEDFITKIRNSRTGSLADTWCGSVIHGKM